MPLSERFFASINFNDAAAFGLSFLTYQKRGDVWVYVLQKERAWTFAEFNIFSHALTNIPYTYEISYAYKKLPTLSDVETLFREFYEHHELKAFTLPFVHRNTNELELIVEGEDTADLISPVLNDFSLLLKELNYEYSVTLTVLEEESEDEFVLDDDVPFVESEEEEFISTNDDLTAQIYEEDKDQLEANARKMIEEREIERRKRQHKYVEIAEIFALEEGDAVDFDGEVYSFDVRTTRVGPLYLLGIGKDGAGINARAFILRNERLEQQLKDISVGSYVRIKGNVTLEKFDLSKAVSISALDELPAPPLPSDTHQGEKRIELHLHSKMSVMDAVTDIEDYVKLAAHMGHKALALTDHGVVQAFPEAQRAGQKYGVKMLYGSELYLVEQNLQYIYNAAPLLLTEANYVVFDFETTGLSARYDKIIEFGAVKVERGLVTKRLNILINPGPGITLHPKITEITSITDRMLAGRPEIHEVIDEIIDFIGESVLVSHNAGFDVGFLNAALTNLGRPKVTNPVIDTLQLSRYLFPEARSHRLGVLARNMEVHYDELAAHRADYDAEVLNSIWQAMLVRLLEDQPFLKHQDLALLQLSREGLTHLWPYHVTVLARNDEGLKDLFKLVSISHTDFMAEVAKIPRDILAAHRKNLLLGSACFNGEVFDAALNKDEETLIKTMEFYDYIEIQPYANYEYLLNIGRVNSEKELKRAIKDIYTAAKKAGKLIVATGDAHYLTKKHKIYRDVYIYAKGVGGTNHPLFPYERERIEEFPNPDMHYRSTTEMIEEMRRFDLFSEEEIHDFVITNPHKINNLINKVEPLKKGLFKPNIANVDELLRTVVYANAHKIYGETLPLQVKERIEQEFSGIISNGYAVIYYLAHQIVKKAVDENYIVGSRGSVGSSLVATFANITEVNPLPPHYVCPKCTYSDFNHNENAKSGYDLPAKTCPNCNTELNGEGQNIPFATFLGFDAEKVPDIDLNFPEDYQKRAHDYTKELFGENNVYRAGTISTVAAKMAFGYVRGYFERIGEDVDAVPRSTIGYLAAHVAGTKRTTGQHPGGIIVIPSEYEVYDFTPIQYPADKIDSEWKTTHLDYNAIHDNVLKLDLLGHKDPVALKMLTEITKIKYEDVPLNDKATLSLFSRVDALNLKENTLNETTGALGIPEFGTSFVRQMLESAKPQTFNDLIIVSGLSHGTNVWLNNAERIIAEGIANLDGVIGCRDDIMTYLMSLGMEGKDAFSIMETVRREKSYLSEDDKNRMRFYGVEEYYINSCDQIKYLFPRAHAAAYVIMAVKVAWFKVHHPLPYYATFFSIRGDNFDIKSMISSKETIVKKINEFVLLSKSSDLNSRDQNIEENLRLTIEMLDRGYKVLNIDLYKSDATNFTIDEANNALIPPFTVVSGLGLTAAQSVIEARVDGPFISIEDLLNRTKLNSQNIERLKDIGALDELPDDNQISLFEFLD